MALDPFRFVTATRMTADDFRTKSPLGRSLFGPYGAHRHFQLHVYCENTGGLPQLYNRAIEDARDKPAYLIFVHDDVHLVDFFWAERIVEGLAEFPIIGVAGNTRRLPRQPSWVHIDEAFTMDTPEYTSGALGHGPGFPGEVSWYGPSRRSCKLLDGVFIALHSETLMTSGLRFDEAYRFHFYDMDFCREAEKRGVSMGTCPIGIVHESIGGFGSPAWHDAYKYYLEKWREPAR